MNDNPEQDFQDFIEDEDNPSHDEQQAEQDRIYDELYWEKCAIDENRLKAAKLDTFEMFRNRFINTMDKMLTKIN